MEGRVAVGVRFDGAGPGVHVRDGFLGVLGGSGNVPEEGYGVRGKCVFALIGAAVVGGGCWAAFLEAGSACSCFGVDGAYHRCCGVSCP